MHHAILLLGTDITDVALPNSYTRPSEDIHHIISDTLSIKEVRQLIEYAFRRPVRNSKTVFVVRASSIAHEAQHALLKILEEPPEHVQIYLILPRKDMLLPTVLSRLHIVPSTQSMTHKNHNDTFQDLKQKTIAERLETVATMVKEKQDVNIQAFVAGAAFESERNYCSNKDFNSALAVVERHILDRGASKKMLLELLVLTTPPSI